MTAFLEWLRPGVLAVFWPIWLVFACWTAAEVLAFVVSALSRWL